MLINKRETETLTRGIFEAKQIGAKVVLLLFGQKLKNFLWIKLNAHEKHSMRTFWMRHWFTLSQCDQNFEQLWHSLEGSFGNQQYFKYNLGKLRVIGHIFNVLNGQIIRKIISPSGHTALSFHTHSLVKGHSHYCVFRMCLRQTVAFPQGDRKFPISALTQPTAENADRCV